MATLRLRPTVYRWVGVAVLSYISHAGSPLGGYLAYSKVHKAASLAWTRCFIKRKASVNADVALQMAQGAWHVCGRLKPAGFIQERELESSTAAIKRAQ